MNKRFILAVVAAFFLGSTAWCGRQVNVAVEFNTHASSFYIAKSKGWFSFYGVNIKSFDSYITGMALSAALRRGGIDAAYMCLIPAIICYANGGVPIKVVCGTHRYGYALVVNPKRIRSIQDLARPGIKVACPREGSPNDCLLRKLSEKFHLGSQFFSRSVVRMSPPMALMALESGRADAAMLPEEFPSMALARGFKKLVDSRDLWPGMQGSVLVVRSELLRKDPSMVKGMILATERAIEWMMEHVDDASKIVSCNLSFSSGKAFPIFLKKSVCSLSVTPRIVRMSITEGMDCTTYVDPEKVQEEIDYLCHLGYIRRPFKAEDILYLRWVGGMNR